MLGAMLKYGKNQSTQANELSILNQKARELELRQRRINLAKEDYNNEQKNKQSDLSDGFIGKILGLATGTGILLSGLTKVMESFDANNIKNSKEGFTFLAKMDPKASKEDIDTILTLLDTKSKEFDKALFKNRLAAYQFNYLEDLKAKDIEKEILEKLATKQAYKNIEKENNLIVEMNNIDRQR